MKSFKIEMHFITGQFNSQIWVSEYLSYKSLLNHFKLLFEEYYNDSIMYVRTEKGLFFIYDFVTEYGPNTLTKILN
ncbi:MAG: hypothetical protein WCI62_02265 [Erysipelotrichaceae bacterium]